MTRSATQFAATALLLLLGSALVGCDESKSTCTPTCDQRSCGDDGCGGICGTCADGQGCDVSGQCDAVNADDCTKTCAELGLACGDHCGQSCGACPAGTACESGQCSCVRDCTGKACHDSDGCGGSCEPCATEQSCEDCLLRLSIADRTIVNGQLREVVLALDYSPPDGAALPGIIDMRIQVEGPAELLDVGAGESVLAAGKSLQPDPETGRPFLVMNDGVIRTVAMSTISATRIEAGRLLFWRFRVGTADGPARVPVSFRVVAREQIFAPRAADEVLWGGGFGDPVVIWPADNAP